MNAANTVSSSTPIAPPCTARANERLLSRWRQPNTRPASAAAEMPARRSSIGTVSQPWSLAYLSSAATPASSTSMPIFTGTLPTVNQRLIARAATVNASGVEGGGGVEARGGAVGMRGTCGKGGGRGAAAFGPGTSVCRIVGPGSWMFALRVSSARVGSRAAPSAEGTSSATDAAVAGW